MDKASERVDKDTARHTMMNQFYATLAHFVSQDEIKECAIENGAKF